MTIRLDTKRDFAAIEAIIKRSDLGLKEPDVVALEPVSNPQGHVACDHAWQDANYDWQECARAADVRVVRNRGYEYAEGTFAADKPTDIYSDTYCLECLHRALHEWVNAQMETLAAGVTEHREQVRGPAEDHEEAEP